MKMRHPDSNQTIEVSDPTSYEEQGWHVVVTRPTPEPEPEPEEKPARKSSK